MADFQCSKCKDTGSGFVAFYSAADRTCDCAAGERLRSWAVLTPAEQNARAEAEGRANMAAADERRRAARAARRAAQAAASS